MKTKITSGSRSNAPQPTINEDQREQAASQLPTVPSCGSMKVLHTRTRASHAAGLLLLIIAIAAIASAQNGVEDKRSVPTSSVETEVMRKTSDGSVLGVGGPSDVPADAYMVSPNVQQPQPIVGTADANAAAGEEGELRLVARVDVNDYAIGALQVFLRGAWGAVCTSHFDNRDAMVACRQLGFSSGYRIRADPDFQRDRGPAPEFSAPFSLENLGCSGAESRLVDCPNAVADKDTYSASDYIFSDYNFAACDPFQGTFARLACGNSSSAEEGDVRLRNGAVSAGADAEYGRLEIFHSGGWGTVCDNHFVERTSRNPSFTRGAEDVACKQLGYKQGFQIPSLVDEDELITASVPIVLEGLSCTGSEQMIADCPLTGLGQAGRDCRHSADVHLVCYNEADPGKDGRMRLMDGDAGPGYEYGRLEVFLRGFWSNVCSAGGFTPDSAQVACSALGYDGGASLQFRLPYPRFRMTTVSQVLFENLPVAMTAVDCDGDETTIAECQVNDAELGECTNRTSSTVIACSNSAEGCTIQEDTAEGAVRLRGGFGTPCDPLHSGFVEVMHFGEWGSICASRREEVFTGNNLLPDVVCRQLGFPYGNRVDPLKALEPFVPRGGVALPPSSTYYYSFYEYYVNPDGIVEEAEEPVDRFWLGAVTCNGPEERLTDCNLGDGFQDDNRGCIPGSLTHRVHVACRHFPVVDALEAVSTAGAEEGDLRLVNEAVVANWVTGGLEMFFEGSWSQICSSGFDAADVNVACRQLGYTAGSVLVSDLTSAGTASLRSVPVFPAVAIDSSGCTGSEERLLDCNQDGSSADESFGGCSGPGSFGLRIACVTGIAPDAGVEGEFRLVDRRESASPGSESGLLEVFHAGAWGTVCDGFGPEIFLEQKTAQIACREMGFVNGVFLEADPSPKLLPPWLSGIQCRGPESGLGECRRTEFGQTTSCGSIQRLFCFSDRLSDGRARLVDGNADENGMWEYGRLEVVIRSIWSYVNDRFVQGLGRRGAQVACRSLGYSAGAQLLAGESSPFPAPGSAIQLVDQVTCDGTEESLGDCDLYMIDYNGQSTDFPASRSAALICLTPSGCSAAVPEPTDGDVRLVPLNGTAVPTAACDEVHFGGVELFREGRWGRICSGRGGDEPADFALDAQVICRQLGFPFGTVMDEVDNAEFDTSSSETPPTIWASSIVCTGKEERLLDCVFPEAFDTETILRRNGCVMGDRSRLSVICRRFEITESRFIRR